MNLWPYWALGPNLQVEGSYRSFLHGVTCKTHLAFTWCTKKARIGRQWEESFIIIFLKLCLWEKSLAWLSGDLHLSASQILNLFFNIKLLSYELWFLILWKAGTGFYLCVSPAPILGPNSTGVSRKEIDNWMNSHIKLCIPELLLLEIHALSAFWKKL